MKLRATAVGLVACVGLAFVPAAHAGLDIGVGIGIKDVSLGKALLVGAIGEFFGIETHIVTTYRTGHGLDLPEVLAALYLARLAGVDHHRTVALHSRGHGWGRMAKDLGIHPGTFNKLRRGMDVKKASNAEFEDAALTWFLSEYYDVRRPAVSGWRGEGQSHLSILLALDLSSKSGKAPAGLIAQRKNSDSWKSVASAAGIAGNGWGHPSKPKGGKAFRPGTSAGDSSSSAAPTNAGGSPGPPGHAGNPGNGKGKGKGHNK